MYRTKRFFAFTFFWFLLLPAHSQYLKIGDTLPHLILPGVLNYSDSNLNVSTFRGKLIILDFWNHRCVPCLQAFPKLDSLQKQFKEKVQIILVNIESKDSTKMFFAKRKKIRQPNLPMITGDTILLSLFPVTGYPYTVWINEIGIIKYFSSSQNVTAPNIQNVISGKKTGMSDPTVVAHDLFDRMRLVEYSSSLSLCNDSLNIGDSQKEIVNEGRSVRIASNCFSALALYKKAYREYDKFNVDTEYGTVIEIKDSAELHFLLGLSPKNSIEKNNRFNYELVLPALKSDERYKTMQQDLDRYFEFEANIEKRKIKSLILKKTDDCNGLATKGGKPFVRFNATDYGIISDTTIYYLTNQPFDLLIKCLDIYTRHYYPFYDETGGYAGNIDIQIREQSLNPLNIDSLRKDLQKVGLNLSFEEREVPVLVLKEKSDK